jgi:PAS domain S-box-containing protein
MMESDREAVLSDPDPSGTGTYVCSTNSSSARWSAGLCAIYGVAETPADERAFLAMVHPEDRLRVEAETTARLACGAGTETRFRILRSDGDVRHLLDRATVERDAEGRLRVLRGVVVDITDHLAGPAPDAAARTFAALVEDAPTALLATDAALQITHASAPARRVLASLGPPVGRDLACALRTLWPESRARAALDSAWEALSGGAPPEGVWRPARVTLPDGRPGLVCHLLDPFDGSSGAAAPEPDAERLRLAGAATGIGFWDVHLPSSRLIWSHEMYDLLALPRGGPASVEMFLGFVIDEDRDRVRTAFQRSLADRTLFSEEFRIRRADGVERRLVGVGRVMWRAGEPPSRVIGVNYDVTEQRAAEAALRGRAEALRALIDGIVGLVGLTDAEGRLLEVNRPALMMGGATRESVIGRPVWNLVRHVDGSGSADMLRDAVREAAAGRVAGGELRLRAGDGSVRDVEFLAAPFSAEADDSARVILSGFDVTDRKRSEAQVRALLREMSHRAKNAYSLVAAIAGQVWRHHPETFFARFSERVAALSTAHDLVLRAAGSDGASLEDIVAAQLGPLDAGLSRIAVEGPAVVLRPEPAQALAMALHELGTNAVKHGALSVPEGRVTLSCTVEGDLFRLTWSERGGPAVRAPAREGFGTLVLGRLTEEQLDATCHSAWRPEGLRWTLEADSGAILVP